MRSAGCAINDFADRDFDAHVERTRERPLAAGEIAPREALAVAALLAAAAFALVLFLNWLAIAAVVRRARDRGDLSVRQALLRAAAGLPRHRLRLRHPDGVRGDPVTACRCECWLLFAANLF